MSAGLRARLLKAEAVFAKWAEMTEDSASVSIGHKLCVEAQGLLREAAAALDGQGDAAPRVASLVDYMAADSTRASRSAAFLRTYAARVLDRSASSWEIRQQYTCLTKQGGA